MRPHVPNWSLEVQACPEDKACQSLMPWRAGTGQNRRPFAGIGHFSECQWLWPSSQYGRIPSRAFLPRGMPTRVKLIDFTCYFR